MIAAISYSFLQEYWWAIISLLGSLLVFLMFVQGGQSLLFIIGKTELQRTMLVNTLGRKWEFTFTTLVTFGGAFFASFPLFYATSFGGAYWVWIAVLFSFILQAVSYEFRSKPSNFLGKKTYEIFLFINGLMGPILIGTAVGTFFNGACFSLNDYNQVIWQGASRGLEAVAVFHNVALGLAVFFLVR
ncbi:MAG TPA: cytochrome d ubiquinol oxidase subunit II, partial [Prolixibacteraceae bacterium]|nr:cytochrome d ubiquinol oxidase subunit II [Prolixibacteraceae bacterium]